MNGLRGGPLSPHVSEVERERHLLHVQLEVQTGDFLRVGLEVWQRASLEAAVGQAAFPTLTSSTKNPPAGSRGSGMFSAPRRLASGRKQKQQKEGLLDVIRQGDAELADDHSGEQRSGDRPQFEAAQTERTEQVAEARTRKNTISGCARSMSDTQSVVTFLRDEA
jgi:hypothetical protein